MPPPSSQVFDLLYEIFQIHLAEAALPEQLHRLLRPGVEVLFVEILHRHVVTIMPRPTGAKRFFRGPAWRVSARPQDGTLRLFRGAVRSDAQLRMRAEPQEFPRFRVRLSID